MLSLIIGQTKSCVVVLSGMENGNTINSLYQFHNAEAKIEST
jgi:hypothetical protein